MAGGRRSELDPAGGRLGRVCDPVLLRGCCNLCGCERSDEAPPPRIDSSSLSSASLTAFSKMQVITTFAGAALKLVGLRADGILGDRSILRGSGQLVPDQRLPLRGLEPGAASGAHGPDGHEPAHHERDG